jgi:hypothetical protein
MDYKFKNTESWTEVKFLWSIPRKLLNIMTCIPIARQRLVKHIPVKRTYAPEGRSFLGNGLEDMPP